MEGDIVIAVNGVEVATTEDVSALKQGLGVGDTMTFTIWRNGEVFDVEVTLMDTNDVFAG